MIFVFCDLIEKIIYLVFFKILKDRKISQGSLTLKFEEALAETFLENGGIIKVPAISKNPVIANYNPLQNLQQNFASDLQNPVETADWNLIPGIENTQPAHTNYQHQFGSQQRPFGGQQLSFGGQQQQFGGQEQQFGGQQQPFSGQQPVQYNALQPQQQPIVHQVSATKEKKKGARKKKQINNGSDESIRQSQG